MVLSLFIHKEYEYSFMSYSVGPRTYIIRIHDNNVCVTKSNSCKDVARGGRWWWEGLYHILCPLQVLKFIQYE